MSTFADALADAGPPMLTLLIILAAFIAYGKAPEIRAFWHDVIWRDK